jgi:hypothetical protein
MHSFGSKDELFARAAHLPQPEGPITGMPVEVGEALFNRLVARMEQEPVTSPAPLRSILTHPDAADDVRAALTHQLTQDSDAIATDDVLLRASLISATTLGSSSAVICSNWTRSTTPHGSTLPGSCGPVSTR